MNAKHQISHRGVNIYIRRVYSVKNGVTYTNWEIPDYSSGKRVRHQRATLDEAKAKAREVCECLAMGKHEVLGWNDRERLAISRALDALKPSGIEIDRAATIFAEALKTTQAEEIVAACRAWVDKRGNRKFTPKQTDEVIKEFLERRENKVTFRCFKSDAAYLNTFSKSFGGRMLHEIATSDVKDWLESRGWKPKTAKNALSIVKMMLNDAVERNYAAENCAAGIKTQRKGVADVGVFTPGQVRQVMAGIDDRLKPFFALLFFSGLRKEEASRLTVLQVREGLKTGSIFVTASDTKTKRSRTITINANLKEWLAKYLPTTGDKVLPRDWNDFRGLDNITQYAAKKTGVQWVPNGPRHSFGTYHLRLHGDAAETVKQMGNSLVQLDQHYSSRADSITRELAAEYFSIMPTPAADVVPMPAAKAA